MSLSTKISSQVNEIGLFAGGSNFIGDIGRTDYIYPNEFAGGIIYKWNWNPRLAVRTTLSYVPISGDDADADSSLRKNRGLSFKKDIFEIAAGVEYNFFEFEISSSKKIFTPYLLLELSAFRLDNKNYTSIPFGIGVKSKLLKRFTISVETKFRYTFDDYIDKVPTSIEESYGNDWYVFSGISINYTFGKPSCYKKVF